MLTRKQLSRIFYIYTEAGFALFLLFGAITEVACGYAINGPISIVAYSAAVLFTLFASFLVLYIYIKEQR